MTDDTPPQGSGAFLAWRDEARRLADRLLALDSPDSAELAGEMLRFEATFAAWTPEHRPSVGERASVIGRFITTNRRVLELLSRNR